MLKISAFALKTTARGGVESLKGFLAIEVESVDTTVHQQKVANSRRDFRPFTFVQHGKMRPHKIVENSHILVAQLCCQQLRSVSKLYLTNDIMELFSLIK